MSTLNAPSAFNVGGNDLNAAGLTLPNDLAANLDVALMDRLNPLELGLIQLKVDFTHSGTDTRRLPYADGMGYSKKFSALASEVAAITPSGTTAGYSSISLGLYGLGHSQTYSAGILGLPGSFMSLGRLIGEVPNSAVATLRYLAAVQGATFSTIIGSATDVLDADDLYALTAAIDSATGASDLGAPQVTIHNNQFSQLRQSLRSEPAFVQDLAGFKEVAGVANGTAFKNFLGMGFDLYKTTDVQSSGGAYQGFAHNIGAMGWAKASPSVIVQELIPAAAEPMALDDYGLLITKTLSDLGTATGGYEARFWVGVAAAAASVSFQRRIRSTN